MRLFLADLEPTPLPAMLAGLTVPFWGRSFIYMPLERSPDGTDRRRITHAYDDINAGSRNWSRYRRTPPWGNLSRPTDDHSRRGVRCDGRGTTRCSVSHSRSLHSSRVLVSSGTRLVSPARRSFRPHRSSLDIKPSWNWSRSASHGSHLRAEFWPDRFRRPCVGSYRLVY